jgi:hypothetical protein
LLVTNVKKLPPFDQIQIFFLQVFIAVVVAFIICFLNTFHFIMKYIKNTAKTRMYMDKSTIYFSNGKQFCGKMLDGCKQNKGA